MPYLIDNKNIHDPRLNLALEEYCLRYLESEKDYLIFYVNEPSVIVGRNQNILEEIDYRYVGDNGIRIVRRISGGGAVYHDYGNLNFSIIKKFNHLSLLNINKDLAPLITALKKLGVNAKLNDRNGIEINGRKISGNAQFSNTRRILVHGTLLFDTDLDALRNALNSKSNHIQSKSLKSIRSPVNNIAENLVQRVGMGEFRRRLIAEIACQKDEIKNYFISGGQWEQIQRLAQEKYNSWDWTWGNSPPYHVHKIDMFGPHRIETRMDVKKGRIEAIAIDTDISANGIVEKLQTRLMGIRYEFNKIRDTTQKMNLKRLTQHISSGQLLNHLYGT